MVASRSYGPGASTPRYTVNVDDGYGRPEAVAFSPDGSTLATGGGTGDIRFWDATTGLEISPRVLASAGWVLDLAWSPSGTTLVSAGTDGTVRLIDVATKTVADVLPGLENLWADATLSSDGSRLYVAYENGQAYDWSHRPRRPGAGRMQHRRSHPDAGGMVPVPAQSRVRTRLRPVTR